MMMKGRWTEAALNSWPRGSRSQVGEGRLCFFLNEIMSRNPFCGFVNFHLVLWRIHKIFVLTICLCISLGLDGNRAPNTSDTFSLHVLQHCFPVKQPAKQQDLSQRSRQPPGSRLALKEKPTKPKP